MKVYTRYIPGIFQSYTFSRKRNIPRIYQVYTTSTFRVYTWSKPGIYQVYTRFMPASLKSCDPCCSISAIGRQRHTGFGLQGCLMFITARADSRRRRHLRRGRRRSNSNGGRRRRSSSWLWRHQRPSRRRRWRRLPSRCWCRLRCRRHCGSRRRRRRHLHSGGQVGGRKDRTKTTVGRV